MFVCVCGGGALNSKLCFIMFSKSPKWTKENMAGSQCHFLLELSLIPQHPTTPWSGVRKEERESRGWIRTNSQYSSAQANERPETPDTHPTPQFILISLVGFSRHPDVEEITHTLVKPLLSSWNASRHRVTTSPPTVLFLSPAPGWNHQRQPPPPRPPRHFESTYSE